MCQQNRTSYLEMLHDEKRRRVLITPHALGSYCVPAAPVVARFSLLIAWSSGLPHYLFRRDGRGRYIGAWK